MANIIDLYNSSLGQYGSSYLSGDGAKVDLNDDTISKRYIISITMLADTTFEKLENDRGRINSISTVTAENVHTEAFGALAVATDITTSHTFPKGVTIFGTWDLVELNSGSCVVYFGVKTF